MRGGDLSKRWLIGRLQGICLAFLLTGATCFGADEAALNSEFLIQQWQTEEGLPQNSVTSIALDPDGYLWMGTFNGLVRFDGHRFVVFDPSTHPALRSSRIVQLYRDGSSMWVISEFQDAAVYMRGELAEPQTEPEGSMLRVLKMAVDPEGRAFLIDTNHTLFEYSDGRVEPLHRFGPEAGRVVWLAASAEGVWTVMKEGFGLVSDGRFTEVEEQSAANLLVEVVEPGRDSQGVWVAGRHSGLRRFQNGEWTLQIEFPGNRIVPTCLLEDGQGRVWVGTLADGVLIWDGEEWTRLCTINGLSHNSIRCVFEDQEGNYWVGTDGGGVNRLRQRFLDVIDGSHGLPSEVILALTPGADDRLWIGFNVHGGGILDQNGFRPLAYAGSIWSFCAARDGFVWTGDNDGGLLGFHHEAPSRHVANPGMNRRVYVRTMHQTKTGALYVGDVAGLMEFKEGVFADLSTAPGLNADDIRALASDAEGRLYAGTNGRGLARREEGEFVFYDHRHGLPENRVWSLFIDAEQNVWVGTFGAGLSRFHDGQFQNVSRAGGVPVKAVTAILEDDLGSLWIGSMQGIFQVSKRELVRFAEGQRDRVSYRRFDRTDGLKTTECNGGYQPAACKMSDGRICFATIKGIVRIDPAEIRTNPIPVAVLVEEILVNERQIAVPAEKRLIVPPGVERLEIRYTGISLSGPEKVRFKYRLEGSDRHWVEAGSRRVAYFSNLSPGRYAFKVQACNSDGIWNEAGAVMGLYIQPFFWQTGWFISMAAILSLGGGAWGVRHFSLKRVRRKLQQMEQQHAFERERSRIAQDIHDDLGARLTQVGLLTELAKRSGKPEEVQAFLSRITLETRDVVQVMDEIVWAVDPEKDRLENLADYVAAFAQEFLKASELRCRLDIPAILPQVPMTAEARHNIVMILKESLNNAVKHSKATQLWVRMRSDPETITIEIKDDGVGFDLSGMEGENGGNGLRNMQMRARRIQGSVNIESKPAEGTTVRIIVPLTTPFGLLT